MFLRLVGKNFFEQLYPIKHFTHQQEQGKAGSHDSGHSEEKYSQHLSICSTVSAAAARSLALSSSTVVGLVVIMVSILFPRIHDDIIFITWDNTTRGRNQKLPLLGQVGLEVFW
jgi:hypothetical protein